MIESDHLDITVAEYQVVVQVLLLLSWIGFCGNNSRAIHTVWPTRLLDGMLEEKGEAIESPIAFIAALPPGTYVCDLNLNDGSFSKYSREHMLADYNYNVWDYLLFPLIHPSWIIHKASDPVSVPNVFNIREHCVRLTDLPKTIPLA